MAVTTILTTDTLEQMRSKINSLAANDFGDIATLDASISATSVIGAVNELNSIVISAAGWFIEDSASSIQAIGSGQTLRAYGTSNQIDAVVSAPDTLTIGLPNDVTIPNDLTVTNNLTASGPTQTLGTIEITGSTIRSVDSSEIKVNDTLQATKLKASTLEIGDVGGVGTITSVLANKHIGLGGIPVINDDRIIFEGNVEDGNETTLVATEPTGARTITIQNATGTLAFTSDIASTTGYATSSIFSSAVSLTIYNSSGVAQKTIYGSAS